VTHRGGGVIDFALGPPKAYAEFAHWASDYRALVVTVLNRSLNRLPPLKRLPMARFE